MTTSFTVSWDYFCPFARNAHEHVLAGLEAGAEWEVTFQAFSLGEAHVEEGQPSIFGLPEERRRLYALAAGVAVRDHFPEKFRGFHAALFAARHDQARDIREESVVREVLSEQGLDAEAVMSRFDDSEATIQKEHSAAVEKYQMFGVPTFVLGDRAVFVRLMDRPGTDLKKGLESIEGVLRIAEEMPTLNEYKFTKISR